MIKFSQQPFDKKSVHRNLLLAFVFIVFFLFTTVEAAAQQEELFEGGGGGGTLQNESPPYQPLAPLPGIDGDAGVTVSGYFSTLYQIGVSLVLVIAVVMLIYGGIQYMTSDSIGGKGNGRETITKAIIGIVLAVSSYALLYLIGGVGSVTVGFEMPEGIEYVAPPPLPPGLPAEESGYYCNMGFQRESGEFTFGSSGLPTCPLSWGERFALFGSGTAQLTEQDLVDFYEAGGYELQNQCAYRVVAHEYIVNLDMGQCQSRANTEGLLEAGTPLGCFESTARSGRRPENQFYCTPPEQKEILFVLPTGLGGAQYDDPGACYQVNPQNVEAIAEDRCVAEGGSLESIYSPSARGLFCLTDVTPGQCADILAGEFMELDGFRDEEWDESFCDLNSIPSGVTQAQREEFEDLGWQLFEDLGLLHLALSTPQTSGYYNDTDYYDNDDAGGGTHWHTGIDISSGGGSAPISSPVSGEVFIMREGVSSHPNNDKFAIIEEGTGLIWVFTHVSDIALEHGDVVEAGQPIANVAANPCWFRPDGSSVCGTAHLDLNIYTDPSMLYGDGSGTDSRNWSEANMTSGRHPDQATIAGSTMCPFQAYWESVNNSI